MVWSDPEVETVAPGIHRVPVPLPNDGLRAVNVYMIEDGDGVTLVDSGWNGPEARAAIDRGLAVAGAELGDVHRMLITHMHYDHLGQADELRRAGAGEYWLGEEEKESFCAKADPLFDRFFTQVRGIVELLLPAYRDEGKAHLTRLRVYRRATQVCCTCGKACKYPCKSRVAGF